MERLRGAFPSVGPAWTRDAALPGGDLPDVAPVRFVDDLRQGHPWMPRPLVHHSARVHGSRTALAVGGPHRSRAWAALRAQLYEPQARFLHTYE